MAAATFQDSAPFIVELRTSRGPGRLLGRAATMILANAIFEAALTAHPGERIVLSQGASVLRDSAPTT